MMRFRIKLARRFQESTFVVSAFLFPFLLPLPLPFYFLKIPQKSRITLSSLYSSVLNGS